MSPVFVPPLRSLRRSSAVPHHDDSPHCLRASSDTRPCLRRFSIESRLVLDPQSLDVLAGRQYPIVCRRTGSARSEVVRCRVNSGVVLPVECHSRGILFGNSIHHVDLGAAITLAAVVLETDLDRLLYVVQFRRAPTKTLRPEVRRLLALASDSPIADQRLPGLSLVGGIVDLICDFR